MSNMSGKNAIYRTCISVSKGDCPFMHLNEYGVECCSIDGIAQVRHYGCTPQKIMDKVNNDLAKEEVNNDKHG